MAFPEAEGVHGFRGSGSDAEARPEDKPQGDPGSEAKSGSNEPAAPEVGVEHLEDSLSDATGFANDPDDEARFAPCEPVASGAGLPQDGPDHESSALLSGTNTEVPVGAGPVLTPGADWAPDDARGAETPEVFGEKARATDEAPTRDAAPANSEAPFGADEMTAPGRNPAAEGLSGPGISGSASDAEAEPSPGSDETVKSDASLASEGIPEDEISRSANEAQAESLFDPDNAATLEAVPEPENVAGDAPDEPSPSVEPMGDAELKAILEAIIYITDEPLTLDHICAGLEQPRERVIALLEELAADCEQPWRGLTVREVAGGFKMATKPEHHEAVRRFVRKLNPPLKLSLPALETLAVIAYKQPITAPEIMEIRGVQGASVLKTLLDRKLIATAGRKPVVGKPILYKTTREFLVQFGLKDVAELPTLKEFQELGRLDSEADAPAEALHTPSPAAPLLFPRQREEEPEAEAPDGETPKEEEVH